MTFACNLHVSARKSPLPDSNFLLCSIVILGLLLGPVNAVVQMVDSAGDRSQPLVPLPSLLALRVVSNHRDNLVDDLLLLALLDHLQLEVLLHLYVIALVVLEIIVRHVVLVIPQEFGNLRQVIFAQVHLLIDNVFEFLLDALHLPLEDDLGPLLRHTVLRIVLALRHRFKVALIGGLLLTTLIVLAIGRGSFTVFQNRLPLT